MKKLIPLLGMAMLAACSPYKNVMIDSGTGVGPCEPSICVNPSNPKNIIAGAVLNTVYHSLDGGKTWKKQRLTSPHGVYGDPCIVADTSGNIYYFHLSDPSGKGWLSKKLLDRIVCQKSTNGGKTWNQGSYMGLDHPKDQDKEWAVIDNRNGNVYCTWTQFDLYDSKEPGDSTTILFSKSTDHGQNWSSPVRISQFAGDCVDDDETVEGAVPAVGPNGEIYVTWALGDHLYFDRSTDEGQTWLNEDIIAADGIVGWAFDIPGINRCNGMPITEVDLSGGEHHGTIYVNWSDQRNGEDNTDIWLIKSSDQGNTWSAPFRVNQDDTKTHQFFTWMDVDPVTGYLYIVYYDRSAYKDTQTDVMLAYSKDGGATFTNVKISNSPFVPDERVFFGDYNNISAYDGVVRPIWTRADGTALSIWTALIEIK